MQIAFIILLFILGACAGSFLCCQARRLHLKTTKNKSLGRRSACLHCGCQLKWHDNIPVISWLTLKGKCRKCHKKIGLTELLSELGLGCAFVLLGFGSGIFSTSQIFTPNYTIPMSNSLIWISFVITLVFVLTIGFLAIYDGLYGELPTLCLVIAILFALVILMLKDWPLISILNFTPDMIWKPLVSIFILGGIYLILYLASKGKWVGDGDWLLGTAIAIALYEPWLALIALFLANFIACLVMFPQIKHKKNHRIHFGPFLVIAYVITASFANVFLALI